MMSKALNNLSILIYGEEPLIPMKIEQSIASIWPSAEVSLESYEDYEDALSHVRTQKSFGLLFVLDTAKRLPLDGVIHNLSKPYLDTTGFPAATILVSTEMPTISGYKAMASNSNIIEYTSLRDLLDHDTGKNALKSLWTKYIGHLDKTIMPEAMRGLLESLAVTSGVSADTLQFKSRLAHFFHGKANLSWIESLALSWFFLIEDQLHLQTAFTNLAASNLVKVLHDGSIAQSFNDLESIAKITSSTGAKVRYVINLLEQWRASDSLSSHLDTLKKSVKPFSPFIIRTIASESDTIQRFAKESSQSTHTTVTRKVG